MSGATGKIRYVAKAKGTWPYYFRADNPEEAAEWVEANLQSYDRKTREPIYEWTISEEPLDSYYVRTGFKPEVEG